MRYGLLRLVSFFIQVLAVVAAVLCIVFFAVSLEQLNKQITFINQLGTSMQQSLESTIQSFEMLSNLLGVPVPSLSALPPSMLQEQVTFLLIRHFLTLFAELFGCLVLFGFGGLLSVVMDIATSAVTPGYQQYSQIDNGDAVTPKPLADFPPSRQQRTRPIGEDRVRSRGKWDVGKS